MDGRPQATNNIIAAYLSSEPHQLLGAIKVWHYSVGPVKNYKKIEPANFRTSHSYLMLEKINSLVKRGVVSGLDWTSLIQPSPHPFLNPGWVQ
ncbi:hypothetical protein J6590_036304 [Homalodisca vitripennis]|nr:hypothetical protein J6590_036304 [Homalodisca vitripennis]